MVSARGGGFEKDARAAEGVLGEQIEECNKIVLSGNLL